MKLLRIKITTPKGFRSLPCGFEHHFRSEWALQDEQANPEGFAPFVCAGRNGSGKSNLLEALAAIFFNLKSDERKIAFLPDALLNTQIYLDPDGFELDYLIKVRPEYRRPDSPEWALVNVWKSAGETVRFQWSNQAEFAVDDASSVFKAGHADIVFPEYVLGYSSGENEILSLPFFKLRFAQYDEYWNALTRQLPYPGHPESRLAYLDSEFSQAILLCNLLFQDEATLRPFREDVGIEALKEFRIILRRSIPIEDALLEVFDETNDDQKKERRNRLAAEARARGASDAEIQVTIDGLVRAEIVKNNPCLWENIDDLSARYRLNVIKLLEGDEKSSLAVSVLKRCATLSYVDEETDTLILDYWVNDATKQAFRKNFDGSPLALFQAFQVLLTLNLYTVSDALKADLYRSTSHYVSETVPSLASDQRIMRFKFVRFAKQGVPEPMMLKELSDGEHQLLHSLGLCLLFKDTNSLFLLDEPETHFNPDWRANFISRLRQCLPGKNEYTQEMLITTHTPFLISDSKPEKVLVFAKDKASGKVSINHPNYNTLGASINKITMNTFGKRETIGGHAQALLEALRARFEQGGEDKQALITEIHQQLGDSVEKVLLIKAILDADQPSNGGGAGLMLFPYTYVPHQMEKMQTFIDFIFHEVWCKAPTSGPFDLNLFDANAELREVMEAFYYSDAQGADFFYGHVERIYGLFSALTAAQINQFQQWYQSNNDVEKVCANDPAIHLARYSDIAVNHKDLAAQLGGFFKGLYSQSLLNLAALRAKIGDIDDHYHHSFLPSNKTGKCPFCGMSDLLGPNHIPRDAYDHYLPKALYPFNSINFRNLVPACHHCNSSYKTSKDPAHNLGERRKAFYPFAAATQTIDIQVALQHADIENLKPADIQLQFGPAEIAEEIETWKDVYGIEERYKAKFCGENDGKYWLTQVLDEWTENRRDPADFLRTLARQAQSRPYADCNFLRRAFLEACQQIGVL